MREHGVPQFTVDAHRPVGEFDLLGVSFSTELGYTNLLTALDLAGIPLDGHGPHRGPPGRDRRRARGVQPRADRRLRRRRGARRRRAGRPARSPRSSGPGRPRAAPAAATSCCCGWPAPAASTSRGSTTSTTCPTAGSSASCPTAPGAVAGRQAHGHGPRRVAVPEAAARPARRDRARADERRDLPRLHPRLPVLPGRHDHPPGPRAEHHRHRRDGRKGPGRNRLRGGRPALPVQRRPLRDRRHHQGPGRPLRGHPDRAVPAEHPGRRVQHRPGQRAVPQRPALRPDLRARGRQRADAQGDQQDGHRGGPDPHRHRGVRRGLAPGEALLHVRPAHRDRRGRPADRRPGQEGHRGRARDQRARATSAARSASAASCPSRTRRSSGPPQLSAEGTDARLAKLRDAIRGDRHYARAIGFRYHDGQPGIVEGLLSRGDRRVGAVIRQV